MLAKRIIPCLDVKNGRTVKGVNFVNLIDAGDPVELAAQYAEQGADELVFLDISATQEERATTIDLVRRVGQVINIPYSVGGGISTVDQVYTLLKNGAEKVSINSSAIRDPQLIERIAKAFGSQCLIVAVDARVEGDAWMLHSHGGTQAVDKELFTWVKEVESRGAGEILFTSMDHDGTKSGFAVEALAKMNDLVSIPVIASGGAGTMEHFTEVFTKAKADAALAASIFHFGEIAIPDLKSYLHKQQIAIRN